MILFTGAVTGATSNVAVDMLSPSCCAWVLLSAH